MNSDIRIARLLQAAAVLTTSGYMWQDAVLTAIDLERQIMDIVRMDEEKKTQGELDSWQTKQEF